MEPRHAHRVRLALETEFVPGFDPVLPEVDACNLTVAHTTCTGRTTMRVLANSGAEYGARFDIQRKTAPFSAQSDRDLAIMLVATLAGIYAPWTSATGPLRNCQLDKAVKVAGQAIDSVIPGEVTEMEVWLVADGLRQTQVESTVIETVRSGNSVGITERATRRQRPTRRTSA